MATTELTRPGRSGWATSGWVTGAVAATLLLGGGGAQAVISAAPSSFHPITPVRVFDTRTGTGGVPVAPIGPGATLTVTIGGTNGIPLTATAVSLNVTVVNGTTSSHLTVWPTGELRPLASNLNWRTDEARPNAVTVALGTNGQISLFNATGSVNVLADAVGYYTPTSAGPPGPPGPAGPPGVGIPAPDPTPYTTDTVETVGTTFVLFIDGVNAGALTEFGGCVEEEIGAIAGDCYFTIEARAASSGFFTWLNDSAAGNNPRRDLFIEGHPNGGTTVDRATEVRNAFITQLRMSRLDVEGSGQVRYSFVVTHDWARTEAVDYTASVPFRDISVATDRFRLSASGVRTRDLAAVDGVSMTIPKLPGQGELGFRFDPGVPSFGPLTVGITVPISTDPKATQPTRADFETWVDSTEQQPDLRTVTLELLKGDLANTVVHTIVLASAQPRSPVAPYPTDGRVTVGLSFQNLTFSAVTS